MATLTSFDFRAPALPWGHAAKATVNRLARRWRDWAANRREIARITHELNLHTDRELADMGLTRGDIDAVARGRFRRA
jgi:uncharacterized protein YjiS (DUF1127 family)